MGFYRFEYRVIHLRKFAVNEKNTEKLKQWESFRKEMQRHKEQLKKLAISFLEVDAFEDAAKCAIKAEGIDFALKRMPKNHDV